MKRMGMGLVLMGCMAVGGCARYEYALIEPEQYAQVIGKEPRLIQYDPLEYRLERTKDKLAVAIVNTTDNPISLLGNRSYATDPRGLSHPLNERTIGPHSYLPLFVPPQRQTFRHPPLAPFGWGLGFGNPFWYNNYGSFYPYYGYYRPWAYDPWDPYYAEKVPLWPWKTGEVRLRLLYEREDKSTFEHRFKLVRRKLE